MHPDRRGIIEVFFFAPSQRASHRTDLSSGEHAVLILPNRVGVEEEKSVALRKKIQTKNNRRTKNSIVVKSCERRQSRLSGLAKVKERRGEKKKNVLGLREV